VKVQQLKKHEKDIKVFIFDLKKIHEDAQKKKKQK
jgi:hypothetical protein